MFQLLYTRLGFLHEAVGRIVFGAAWNRRRLHVIPDDVSGRLLDLGCGEGRLLASIAGRQAQTIGIEPSTEMSRRAKRRGAHVIQATAQSLPLCSGTIRHVIATYPGPWILDQQTWAEIARVTTPDATIQILLGGDVSRGGGVILRRVLLRLAYGSGRGDVAHLPALGNRQIFGEYELVDDEWGQAIVWSGMRRPPSS